MRRIEMIRLAALLIRTQPGDPLIMAFRPTADHVTLSLKFSARACLEGAVVNLNIMH